MYLVLHMLKHGIKVYITVSHFLWDCVNVFYANNGNCTPRMENEKGKSEIWVQSKKAFDADKETFVLFLLPKDCEWQRSLKV